MATLPVFTFTPILKELVWGGRRLGSLLGKALPTASTYGESWEVVDLPGDQSVVAGGPLRGTRLCDLLKEDETALLGDAALLGGRFPLLFKLIDAQQTLSVQVHPNEEGCARLGDGARPKTEAWYIIDAAPEAVLYAGLREGVTRASLESAIAKGTVASLLHEVAVSPGDFVYLPAGTIHAIGAGILLAEVQQSSNTTYRVFDWNRVGLDGKPRALHLAQALEATDFTAWGLPPMRAPASGRPGVVSDFFAMEAVALTPGRPVRLTGEGLLVLMGVGGSGKATIVAGGQETSVRCGETRLIPACIADGVELAAVENSTTLLAVRIP